MNKEKQTKKVYFISDFHLGIPDKENSLKREKLLINWLDEIKNDASEIYLMGDVFDFWFEYKTVVPKGYLRFFGKIAEICDSGIPIHLFRGNHDIWAFNYFQEELNIQLHRKPEIKIINSKKFYLAHGDGLGPGDKGYKFLRKIFEFKFNQWLFKWLHPDIGARMGLYFSRRSRIANLIKEGKKENNIKDKDEMLYKYSKRVLKDDPSIDFFVFGHKHVPRNVQLSKSSRLIILGDWLTNFTYAVFDGEEIKLKKY